LRNFPLGWPGTTTLISALQVAKITGVSNNAWPKLLHFSVLRFPYFKTIRLSEIMDLKFLAYKFKMYCRC
jgi:hypothetical protein